MEGSNPSRTSIRARTLRHLLDTLTLAAATLFILPAILLPLLLQPSG